MANRYIVALTTTGSRDEAEKIAVALVESRLAACVNIISDVLSVYKWKGETAKDREWLLMIKTRQELFDRLKAKIRELHSYELPEAIAIEVTSGDPGYLSWIDQCTGEEPE